MAEKHDAGAAFIFDGPKVPCPHCQYENLKPEDRYLVGIQSVLCKRCQQEIPVESFKKL
jgi:transposase-like protein